jgi:uncharacterized protein
VTDPNLLRFRAVVAGALAHFESRRQEVNDLNVFPVADGDTGDNMALTLRAVLDELDRLQADAGDRTIDEIGREEIVHSVARAALLGARGNSGVILSQLIRGAAEELISRPGELVDATLIGAAMHNAAARAYESVREPAEGTMLTVARKMADQISIDVAHSSKGLRFGPETDPSEQDESIAAALERAVATGEDAVKHGPELLAALREAGVVDAGAYGLTLMFAGVVAVLRGDDPPELEHHAPPRELDAHASHGEHSSSTYRWCTNFAVTGKDLVPASFIAPLEKIGDSVLVVGDENVLKVHVHTDAPERATALFDGVGKISREEVADMRAQVSERDARLAELALVAGNGRSAHAPLSDGRARHLDDASTASGNGSRAASTTTTTTTTVRSAAVAVTSGAGIALMFEELGVRALDGGPTLNPSTEDVLAAIEAAPHDEVLVLPNSANVVMAAEHAARLARKHARVVPTSSQQAALAAAIEFVPERALAENERALLDALARVRTGAVAAAARDDARGRFVRGDAVGFIGDELRAWGEPGATLRAIVGQLVAGDRAGERAELVSVLAGDGAPLTLADVEALVGDVVELELRDGGQPAYWWLLAAE